jgi:hypothetical protein
MLSARTKALAAHHSIRHRATQRALTSAQFTSQIAEPRHVSEYRASYDRYVSHGRPAGKGLRQLTRAVGGTRLSLGAGIAWAGETVWNGDGATGGGSVEKTFTVNHLRPGLAL